MVFVQSLEQKSRRAEDWYIIISNKYGFESFKQEKKWSSARPARWLRDRLGNDK